MGLQCHIWYTYHEVSLKSMSLQILIWFSQGMLTSVRSLHNSHGSEVGGY